MPRATAGNRHGVLRQPLCVLLKVTGDWLRQLGQTRHGALQGQVRLRGDEPPHRRLAPLGQTHPIGHQAWPVVRLGRLVPGEPLAKVRDRVGDERRAGEGEAKRKAAPTNMFTNGSHAGGRRSTPHAATYQNAAKTPAKKFGDASALRVGPLESATASRARGWGGRAVPSAPGSRRRLGQPSPPSPNELGLLDVEEARLPAGAAGETADAPVRRQHPVARDNDRDRVGAAGGSDSP